MRNELRYVARNLEGNYFAFYENVYSFLTFKEAHKYLTKERLIEELQNLCITEVVEIIEIYESF